jgi:hypothetical protein
MGCFKLTAVAFAVMSLFSVRAQAIDAEIHKDSNGNSSVGKFGYKC